MKKELKRLDEQIKSFEQICINYPLHDGYKDMLAKLRTQRANLVSKIGKK